MLQTSPRMSSASAAADIAACRALLADGSRTFYAASFLLPKSVREPASALYAFCRLADDAIDIAGGNAPALADLSRRLDLAYRGTPLERPVDRAFARTVTGFAVPRELPEALIEGLAWDVSPRRYADLAALNAYAARVAGTVGAMMAVLMGVRDADLVARACDLGVAMQLTNIARDVGEDARAGRLYLPESWMHDAGLDPDDWLARPAFSPALGEVLDRLLRVADILYVRADAGIAELPRACRPGIRAARLLYAAIGDEVRRRGCNSVDSRAVVAPARKAMLIANALGVTDTSPERLTAPCLAETQFLADAVARSPAALFAEDGGIAWWKFGERWARVLEIFDEVERRERAGASVSVDRIAVEGVGT